MPLYVPGQPEAFPDLDWKTAGIIIPETAAPQEIGGGFNSSAWRIGDKVFKVTKGHQDVEQLLGSMRGEHELLEDFLGDDMPPTEYSIAWEADGGTARVVTVQPFVEGISVRDFLANPDYPTDPLQKFLEKCKAVYRARRLMPDVANIQSGFNPLRSPNVLMSEEGTRALLVDTTFGKTQRREDIGPAWNTAIYVGAVVAHKRLRLRAHGIIAP